MNNVTVPTRKNGVLVERIVFTQRQLDHQKYNEHIKDTGDAEFWLSCDLLLGVIDLDRVSIHWSGGLLGPNLNQTELDYLYTIETTKYQEYGKISTKLRLNVLVTDQRVYGEYRCVFSLHKDEPIVGTVYIHVPPIIRLLHTPPPLQPDNCSYSNFTCPSPCLLEFATDKSDEPTASNASVPSTFRWKSACSVVVAYPPVEVTWAWNRPDQANSTIQLFLSRGLDSLLGRLHQMWYRREDDFTGYGPRVLERRRRFVNPQQHLAEVHVKEIMELAPAVFWCWARNDWGDTAVWWPANLNEPPAFAWSTISWPLFGVTLELVGLALLFVGFYYCCRKNSLTSQQTSSFCRWNRTANRFAFFSLTPISGRQENIPFHLLSADTVSVPSVALVPKPRVCGPVGQSSPAPVAGPANSKSQQAVYTRLSSSYPDDPDDQGETRERPACHSHGNRRGCDNPGLTFDAAPNRRHCRTSSADLNTGEEYFWDSDAEGAPGVNRDTVGHIRDQR